MRNALAFAAAVLVVGSIGLADFTGDDDARPYSGEDSAVTQDYQTTLGGLSTGEEGSGAFAGWLDFSSHGTLAGGDAAFRSFTSAWDGGLDGALLLDASLVAFNADGQFDLTNNKSLHRLAKLAEGDRILESFGFEPGLESAASGPRAAGESSQVGGLTEPTSIAALLIDGMASALRQSK
jgi:hypothetical protein